MSFQLSKITAGCLACLSFVAAAQQSVTPIEVLSVTATRSQASLADVAGNLSVITGDTLQSVSHEHIQQAMVRVPGAWISRGNGQEHLTAIRSPVLTGAGGCGAFVFAEDGISLRAPGFCNINMLFDVNSEQAGSIEVLRGPGSTLFGSNAVHGVINVLTPDPLALPDIQLGLEAGPNDYVRGRLGWTHKYQHSALAIYGNLTNDGGYKDDSGFDQQKFNVVHQYQKDALAVKTVLSLSNLNQETAGFIQGFEAYTDESRKRENPNPEAYRDNQTARFYSKVEYRPDENTAISITPYLRWTDMTFLQHFLPWQPVEENSHYSAGFKSHFERQYDDIVLMTGFDLDLTRGELQETQDEPFAPTLPEGDHYDYRVDASVISPFARVTWQATDDLVVTAGARREFTTFDYDNRLSDGSACAEGVEGCRFSRPADQEVSYSEWSYQVGANYRLTDDHRLYAKASRGYRAPQATELFRLQAGQLITDIDAETLDALEVGVRGQWHSLFYDVTAFDMKKDDVIFQDTQRQNISGGSTTHRGIELALNYQHQSGFFARFAGTLARHEYDSDLTLSRESIQGNDVDTAPRHMASLQAGWDWQDYRAEFEWVHMGDYYLNPENTAEYEGHDLLNLRASARITDEITASVRLLNLTDEDYAERADFAFGNYRYFVGEPRSVFFSLSYQLR